MKVANILGVTVLASVMTAGVACDKGGEKEPAADETSAPAETAAKKAAPAIKVGDKVAANDGSEWNLATVKVIKADKIEVTWSNNQSEEVDKKKVRAIPKKPDFQKGDKLLYAPTGGQFFPCEFKEKKGDEYLIIIDGKEEPAAAGTLIKA